MQYKYLNVNSGRERRTDCTRIPLSMATDLGSLMVSAESWTLVGSSSDPGIGIHKGRT